MKVAAVDADQYKELTGVFRPIQLNTIVIPQYGALHKLALHYITLHYIALHHVTLLDLAVCVAN